MRMLDLFTGIGGFSLAASWVWGEELDLAGFCEQDVYCGKVLKKNFPDVPIYPDIKELRGEWFQDIDLITGGFPCQDISVAGKGAGIDGDRSGLWSELCRIISEVRPRYALIENVPMLIHRGLERVLLDLTEIGYDAEWQVIGADDVGARHKRKRIWIVAYPGHLCGRHDESRDVGLRSGKQAETSIGNASQFEVAGPGKEPEAVAHADDAGSGASADGTDGNGSQENQGRHRQPFSEPGRHGETMAHTQHAGRPETEIAGQDHGIQPAIASGQELCLDELEGTSGLRSPGDMADTASEGLERGVGPQYERPGMRSADEGETIPDTASVGSSGSGQSQYSSHQTPSGKGETANFIDERIGDIWTVEPDVGRVANGIPKRVDRLRGLGNAIVPQVAALIMQMIKDDI